MKNKSWYFYMVTNKITLCISHIVQNLLFISLNEYDGDMWSPKKNYHSILTIYDVSGINWLEAWKEGRGNRMNMDEERKEAWFIGWKYLKYQKNRAQTKKNQTLRSSVSRVVTRCTRTMFHFKFYLLYTRLLIWIDG